MVRDYEPHELPNPKNADLLVHVGGRLWPRAEAKVSVFDSSVQGGDAVWEGLRVYNGKIFRLAEHLDRLMASAHALVGTSNILASIAPGLGMAVIFNTVTTTKLRRARLAGAGNV